MPLIPVSDKSTKEGGALISVIIATYNGGHFLQQQLETVINQSYKNLEIIVVDDCSTDDTIAIVKQLMAKDSRVQLVQNERNLGYIKNFEKGCTLANGDFIALCDQDDAWHLDKIKKSYGAIESYPMLYCDSVVCDKNLRPVGITISNRVNCRNFNDPLQQAVSCRIYGHTILMRKDFAEKTIPFLPVIPHDWWLCYMATLHGGIKYLNEQLVYYRQHSNNLFGIIGSKRKGHREAGRMESGKQEVEKIKIRINAFYEQCPGSLWQQKQVLHKLNGCYQSFSLRNNFKRMFLFFAYHKTLLAPKKRSLLQQWLFCFKMFVKIT